MARLVYGMNQSLDGFVDHDRFGPDPGLFGHFIEQARESAGAIYGRRLYELMQFWDQDDWDEEGVQSTSDLRAFALAWRAQPKWVVSRSLSEVGPNATLVDGDLEATVRELKERVSGVIEVGGPALAGTLSELGLIDEYQIYLHPVVLGSGQPYFTRPVEKLRLVGSEQIGDEAVRLTYVPHRAPPA